MRMLKFGFLFVVVQLFAVNICHAELSINPHRLILEESDRSATVTLLNRGADLETYRIYWVYRRMTDGLGVEDAASADEVGVADAAAIIRYAPRQVTLLPGQSQTVRLLVRRPADLAEGEYRAHLMFRREPNLVTNHTTGGNELSLSVHVAYGITIPVIVRHGNAALTTAEMQGELDPSGATLRVSLLRRGTHSLYGHLQALHIVDGVATILATVPNLAIYSEIDSATRNMNLDWPNGEPRRRGEIRLELRDLEGVSDRLIARHSIALR